MRVSVLCLNRLCCNQEGIQQSACLLQATLPPESNRRANLNHNPKLIFQNLNPPRPSYVWFWFAVVAVIVLRIEISNLEGNYD